MKRIARLIGLFSAFLFVFMAAVLVSHELLRKHTVRLRAEAIEQKQAQLAAALELARIGPPPWADGIRRGLEATIGAEIRSGDGPRMPENTTADTWSFHHRFGADTGAPAVEVVFTPTPASRLVDAYQRTAAAMLILALCLIFLFGSFLLWSIRSRETIEAARTIGADEVRAGFQSLQQLASVSARQSAELEHERAGRLRVQEDLHIKQLLLNRALEQKIRLGQDLHDGIIQSLYATGLTLEATRGLVANDPAAAAARIADSTKALNSTIHEVRAYINGLSPDTLRRQTFAEAVGVLTRELGAGRTVDFTLAIDESTASVLAEDTATDLLQVVREAVSNSLRHGRAGRITVELSSVASRCHLRITDDGTGLPVDGRINSGHGLQNIEDRVRRHGGTVAIESAAGLGTTVDCALPAPAPAPAPNSA